MPVDAAAHQAVEAPDAVIDVHHLIAGLQVGVGGFGRFSHRAVRAGAARVAASRRSRHRSAGAAPLATGARKTPAFAQAAFDESGSGGTGMLVRTRWAEVRSFHSSSRRAVWRETIRYCSPARRRRLTR